MLWIKELFLFIRNVANDERIPASDKKILLVILALIISPFDIIPDWIPLIGFIDDIVLISVILDYFFNHLERTLLLSHFPWSLKTFLRFQRVASAITWITPAWIKNKIWTYKPAAY